MKLETAKSLLLIILISTSLVLTFGMWNYRPEYEPLSDVDSVDKEDLGGDIMQASDVMQPTDVVFKMNGQYFGYTDPVDSTQFFEEMQQWELTNIRSSDIEEDRESGAEVEIIFPTDVPLSVFDNILNTNSSLTDITNFYTDRFYIDLEEDEESLHVQFVSSEGDQIVEADIPSMSNFDRLLTIFGELDEEEYEEQHLMTETDKDIYIPTGQKTLTSYSYTFDTIPAGDIRNIMFSNPNLVNVSESESGSIMYRTDNRQINIAGHGMRFIDVAERNNEPTDKSVLQQSLEDINDHAGFTDDYRLENFTDDSVSYRLFHFQYPVINNSNPDLSLIYQQWQNDQLSEYNRSLISLETVANTSSTKLRDSGEVMESIWQNDNVEDIQDIQIAYHLTIESDDNGEDYVLLEPDWYQRINNNWSPVPEQNTDAQQNTEGGN
ncbi:YycH family regulatory protein [Oceanobacillus locisalsi]|uniref:YycH family regulatory protein n=1 Tax=Oceanobacillus locisalsi TaxID=546107 RepID=A0ABW3NG84_9BACI